MRRPGGIQEQDADGVAGGLVPESLEGRGQHGIVRPARQVLQVHRELGVNDVQAPGSPGARCILQARQRQVVFHYVRCPAATCDAF